MLRVVLPEPPNPFAGWLLYDEDELIFDGGDPSTYIVCYTAEDLVRPFAALTAIPDS